MTKLFIGELVCVFHACGNSPHIEKSKEKQSARSEVTNHWLITLVTTTRLLLRDEAGRPVETPWRLN